MLVFKHEGILTFVGRLVHDREFCEWFASQPRGALASHGLVTRDLQDLAGILRTDRRQRDLAMALQPVVETLLTIIDEADDDGRASLPAERLERLDGELRAAQERLAFVRARRPRPWWKFWS